MSDHTNTYLVKHMIAVSWSHGLTREEVGVFLLSFDFDSLFLLATLIIKNLKLLIIMAFVLLHRALMLSTSLAFTSITWCDAVELNKLNVVTGYVLSESGNPIVNKQVKCCEIEPYNGKQNTATPTPIRQACSVTTTVRHIQVANMNLS